MRNRSDQPFYSTVGRRTGPCSRTPAFRGNRSTSSSTFRCLPLIPTPTCLSALIPASGSSLNGAQSFGTGPNRTQNYVISRNELNADLRVDSQLQMFVQFQSDFAPWKTMLSPVDVDRLDLEQAFIALTEPVGDGTLKLRLGRQQFAFDLQRFVSVRDGPNVRQSYDAGWADYENGPWRFITLTIR